MASQIEVGLLLKAKADMAEAEKAVGGIGAKLGAIGGPAKAAGMAVAGGLVVGAGAAAALGAAALDIGMKWDDAGDSLAIATGKTGPALDALNQSLKNVVGSVPDDLATVTDAMGQVAARTGQTGPELEALTTQMLNLARMTGTDAAGSVENLTRMLGDASVPTEDQAAALDTLFKASQATGVETDRLSGLMTSFGAPMRNLGMSFEDSAALLGRFEKEGVNTELVMGALKTASAKWAKEGLAPAEGLKQTIAKIQELGPSAEATGLAMETFGVKAGGDMVDTILGGKFAIDDLKASIADMPNGINGAAESTDGFAEKISIMKNKATVALEPLGTMAVDAMGKLVDAVMPAVTAFTEWLPGAIESAKPVLEGIATAVGGVFSGIGDAVAGVDFGAIFGGIADAVAGVDWGGIGATVSGVFAALAAAVAGVDWGTIIDGIVTGFRSFLDVAIPLGATLIDVVVKAFDFLWPIIAKVIEFISPLVGYILPLVAAFALLGNPIGIVIAVIIGLIAVFQSIGPVLAEVAANIAAKWEEIRAGISEKIEAIRAWIQEKWDAIKAHLSAVIENIRVGISQGWDRIKEYLVKKLTEIRDSIQEKWDAAKKLISDAMTAIGDGIRSAWDTIKGAIDAALEFIRGIIERVWNGYVTLIRTAMETIKGVVTSVWDAIRGAIDTAVGLIRGILDGIVTFLRDTVGGAWTDLQRTIKLAVEDVKIAIRDGIAAAVKFFQPILDKIRELTGIDLAQIGRDIVEGLARGIENGFEAIRRVLRMLSDLLPQVVKDALGIESPSTVFAGIGRDIVRGLAEGIEGASYMVRDAIAAVAEEAIAFGQSLPALFGTPDTVGGASISPASHWWTGGLATAGTAGIGLQTPSYSSTSAAAIMDLNKSARALGDVVGDLSRSLVDWREASMDLVGGQTKTAGAFQTLMEKIQSSPWIGLGGDLKKWAKAQGFDEETVEGIGDLHTMRTRKGWKTDWARELFERRRSGRSYGRNPWQASTYGQDPIFTDETNPPGTYTPGAVAGTAMVQAQDVTVSGLSGGKVSLNDMTIDHVAIAMPAVSVTVSGREIASAITMDPAALSVVVNAVAVKLSRVVPITP